MLHSDAKYFSNAHGFIFKTSLHGVLYSKGCLNVKYNRSRSIPFATMFSSCRGNFFTSAADLFSLLLYKAEKKLLPCSEVACK